MPAPKAQPVTVEKLKEMLDYNAETGDFRWKISPAPSVRVGSPAGYKSSDGSSRIMINYIPIAVRRLAWLYVTGEWPVGLIKHVNGDNTDTRFANLAIANKGKKDPRNISLIRLRNDLDYNAETGEFCWRRTRPGPVKVNDAGDENVAGAKMANGYILVSYLGCKYLAHRLAWFYTYGEWPEHYIDHVNGKRDDNRIANLREATISQNGQNGKHRVTNTTGFKGVNKSKNGTYFARLTANNHIYTVGFFKTPEEAADAYAKLAAEHHGDFARLN